MIKLDQEAKKLKGMCIVKNWILNFSSLSFAILVNLLLRFSSRDRVYDFTPYDSDFRFSPGRQRSWYMSLRNDNSDPEDNA